MSRLEQDKPPSDAPLEDLARSAEGARGEATGASSLSKDEPRVGAGWSALLSQMVFGAGVVILIASLFFMLSPKPKPRPSPTPVSAVASLPSPIPTPTLEPTSTPSPVPTAPPATDTPTPYVPAPSLGGVVLALTPAASAVGWASSLGPQSHFDDRNIHVGFFEGHIYYGVVRFDLSAVPPNLTITYAAVELTGLDDRNLGQEGTWKLRLLGPAIDGDRSALTYDAILDAPVGGGIPPGLTPSDLASGRVNVFTFAPKQLTVLQKRLAKGVVSFRLDGPSSGSDNLFTWHRGYGEEEASGGTRPVLRLVVVPSSSAQALAPSPTPTPTATPTYVVVTSTPQPKNILTRAAVVATARHRVRTTGTPTPLPPNWVTPIIVTNTPTPRTSASATFVAAAATARAFLRGTPTPFPPNVWTATPAPTPTSPPLLIPVEEITPTPPRRTPTPTPSDLPAVLKGKIVFWSDRLGKGSSQHRLFAMDPDGSHVALLTDRWAYDRVLERQRWSANGRKLAYVDYYQRTSTPAIYIMDTEFGNKTWLCTTFGVGRAYDPVWSPVEDTIALVSNDSRNDEIWIVRQGPGHTCHSVQQLTHNTWEWDKHPSWSPDGEQIVFWSNRETGRKQIWITSADGSEQRNISNNEFNDWDPVWIK